MQESLELYYVGYWMSLYYVQASQILPHGFPPLISLGHENAYPTLCEWQSHRKTASTPCCDTDIYVCWDLAQKTLVIIKSRMHIQTLSVKKL